MWLFCRSGYCRSYAGGYCASEMCRSGYCVQCKSFAGVVHFSVQELCRWEWVAGNGSKSLLHEVFMGWKERQACIPCKVDCLHLTGCTICILPQTPSTFLPKPPAHFPHCPLNFAFPTFTPFPSSGFADFNCLNITLYCRVSQQNMLHLSGHILDCARAAEELEGAAGGDLGPTFS